MCCASGAAARRCDDITVGGSSTLVGGFEGARLLVSVVASVALTGTGSVERCGDDDPLAGGAGGLDAANDRSEGSGVNGAGMIHAG